MAKTDVTLVKQGYVAVFAYTAANLAQVPQFLGVISAAALTGLSKSKGALNPVYAKNSAVPGQIDIVDITRSAPDLGESTLEERMHKAALNYVEKQFREDCPQVWLVKISDCKRPDDLASWSSLHIVEGLQITDLDMGAMQSFDANEIGLLSATFNFIQSNKVLPIRFAKVADDTVLAEVLDIISSDEISCGSCAPYSGGCSRDYAITRANTGSPGLSSQLVYTEDGWATDTNVDIATLGGKDASRLAAVGKYLCVISEADGAHHYIPKDAISASGWSRVATGYQVGGAPRAIFAKSPSEVFIGGAGGYIYFSDDITAGVTVRHDGANTTQNFNKAHGSGEVIVMVGNSNTVMLSINNGQSFSLLNTNAGLTGPEAGANLLSVHVVGPYQWYVGTSTGKMWYTANQGKTWTQRALPNQSNLLSVNDIKASPDSNEVMAVAVQTLSLGYVYRSISGGRTWFDNAPGIAGIPALERINNITLCGVNRIAGGGKKSASTDGIIVVAE